MSPDLPRTRESSLARFIASEAACAHGRLLNALAREMLVFPFSSFYLMPCFMRNQRSEYCDFLVEAIAAMF